MMTEAPPARMFIGVLRLTLHLPEPGSLKSKRHLVRSALDRVRARYNVSIAEVAENDLWQRSVIGVAAVGNDHSFVNEVLDKVATATRRVLELGPAAAMNEFNRRSDPPPAA